MIVRDASLLRENERIRARNPSFFRENKIAKYGSHGMTVGAVTFVIVSVLGAGLAGEVLLENTTNFKNLSGIDQFIFRAISPIVTGIFAAIFFKDSPALLLAFWSATAMGGLIGASIGAYSMFKESRAASREDALESLEGSLRPV